MMTKYVFHQDELMSYEPDAHRGVTNIRLIEPNQVNSRFEMIIGTVASGGAAEPHYHEEAFQVYYVLEGQGLVKTGDDPPADIRAGSVIVIPPGIVHSISATSEQCRLIVIYSPPLPPDGIKVKKD